MSRAFCLLAFALAGVPTGCAAPAGFEPLPASYTVHVASAWGERTPLVVEALDRWHAAVGVTFAVSVSDEACPETREWLGVAACVLVRPAPAATVGAECDLGSAGGGCTRIGTIDISDAWGESLTLEIAMHEIGHALGLVHTTDPAALMYPVANGVADVTPEDAAQYRALRPLAR